MEKFTFKINGQEFYSLTEKAQVFKYGANLVLSGKDTDITFN